MSRKVYPALADHPSGVKIHVCTDAKHVHRRSEEWDAKYCVECDEWLEPKCGVTPEEYGGDEKAATKECFFQCWNRPDRPSKVKMIRVEGEETP
jgi:hypothetical protein